jgi:cyclophilin family peptidyl-prolyl cis-trans isomerase/HEAT repeat protein
MSYFLRTLLLLLIVSGCTTRSNKFSDPIILKIGEFQDRRQTDSLIHMLLNKNPIYRTEAAMALGSVQDSTASLQLGSMLLEDPVVEARKAAAFALGQTNGTASVNALIPALEDKDASVVYEALVALGKVVGKDDLSVLKKFKTRDTLKQASLAWAFYYVGLRGLADSTVAELQKNHLKPNHSYQTRLGAAHFFSRASKLSVTNSNDELIAAALNDKSTFVRMAAASALRKLDSAKAIEPLNKIIKTETDYRVRVMAVRALASFANNSGNQIVIEALDDVNQNVGMAASEALRPTNLFYDQLITKAREAKNKRIQSNLYKTVLALSPSDPLIEEVKKLYSTSKDDYQKASLLNAMSAHPLSYSFVANELMESKVFVIQTAAAQALVDINRKRDFDINLKEKFAGIYKNAIAKGDAGVIGIIASVLADSTLNYERTISDFSFLIEAKKKLSLPKDFEAIQPLNEAIAYFEGKKVEPTLKNHFNHPINWELVKSIRKDQRVKIQTAKGEMVIRLLVEDAPGSVVNFVELLNRKYFDGKNFHRVVPNFVVQGGCNRGDGYGSEDYSIRSEFSSRDYKEGSLGMASAGKDTEGTQWFITHSPTPHLNGHYTIFAEVESGMEVVHTIEVGDTIIKVSLNE